jgi:hypothetical protein
VEVLVKLNEGGEDKDVEDRTQDACTLQAHEVNPELVEFEHCNISQVATVGMSIVKSPEAGMLTSS